MDTWRKGGRGRVSLGLPARCSTKSTSMTLYDANPSRARPPACVPAPTIRKQSQQTNQTTNRPTDRPRCLPIYRPTYLPIELASQRASLLRSYLPIYRPTYQPTDRST